MNREETAGFLEQSLRDLLRRVGEHSTFYRKKFQECGFNPMDFSEMSDFTKLPFTYKEELREAYPLGLQAVPDRDVVRIHSSSGTTGKAVIIPYTKKDVYNWSVMFARCYAFAGVTREDRVQITPGYGLWTAGIGFQAGAERLGAMAIPMGPGNTEKQIQMMLDLKSTVLCSTSSYALLLAEEIQKRKLREALHLKIGILGSERWGEKMRARIENELGIESFDIYGLTEIYGPGIGIDCKFHQGIHYWSDHLYFEIIDPLTGRNLPHGELGELVVTTLTKEGAPLVRYRTRDLTRMIPGICPCGSVYPRIDRILGRSDDMIKIKGVNIYPGQIEEVLKETEGASSEYQIRLMRVESRDHMQLTVEVEPGSDPEQVAERIRANFKKRIGILIDVRAAALGELPRSEKKSKRVFDEREI
ncbi:MAG: phenylacetate--CoA ligase [Firmicutes bacterium]|nr:phenylacetate--CoA ligase [Bacillota bacterium]